MCIRDRTTTILFAMAMGVLWLSTVPPTSGIVTEMFGPTNSGALFGIVFLSHQMGSFIGAWMGGEVVDITGSYAVMWWLAVGLGVFAMAMHLLLDEGPAPTPPTGGSRGVAPGAAALFILIAGTAAAISLATTPASAASLAATDTSAEHDQPAMTYCALGPIVLER